MRVQITSDDVSLYHLAVRYLGNAMHWWRIAEKNGLSDPDLSAFDVPVMLVIPDRDSGDDGSGVLSR